jgi:hypothetical protein
MLRGDMSVVQRVYEFVIRADRVVRTREIVAGVGASSVSSVTFALTRLVREGNLARVGYARYKVSEDADRDSLKTEPRALDERLAGIFESIRPVLSFADLAFLYTIVLTARRVTPDLFEQAITANPRLP